MCSSTISGWIAPSGIVEETDLISKHHKIARQLQRAAQAVLVLEYPHLEELYRVGEAVMPVLRDVGLLAAGALAHDSRATIEVTATRSLS